MKSESCFFIVKLILKVKATTDKGNLKKKKKISVEQEQKRKNSIS